MPEQWVGAPNSFSERFHGVLVRPLHYCHPFRSNWSSCSSDLKRSRALPYRHQLGVAGGSLWPHAAKRKAAEVVKTARRTLRSAPVWMLPRVRAPAQTLEVEVPRIAEEVPQLHEEAVRYVPQPKDSDVLTSALRATGSHGVCSAGLCRLDPRE